jgi:predicted O-linked N-acetylglucosamine transferase (SPINDLY family)
MVEAAPTVPQHRNNLANALAAAGRSAAAAAEWRRALEIDPRFLPAFFGLCEALVRLGEPSAAVEIATRGLALEPAFRELAFAQVGALEAAGRVDEALSALDRLLAANPGDALLAGRRLALLNYLPLPPQRLAAALADHRRCTPAPAAPPPPPADPDPDRPLRIGILSGDLRTHSVAYFADALTRHRPEGTGLVAFSTSPADPGDPVVARLRNRFDAWVEAAPLDDAGLDRAIRERRIDLLLELAGHFSGGRLGALSNRPAPVVVTAIGYPASTGHPAVDWRLVDSITDPPGSEQACTERLLRLDPCFLCYTPPDAAPPPEMPPESAPITFASFNLATKISDPTLQRWALVLAAVPEARLLIKSRGLDEAATRDRLAARFEAVGVARDRLDLVAWIAGVGDHLALYGRVHLALDTTPYSGTTTTCEALWMGVPVVTLPGDLHRDRVSASLLCAAGFPELVARDPAEFVRIASDLAGDRPRLARFRREARDRLRASPLLDAEAYVDRLHALLRRCWREACGADGGVGAGSQHESQGPATGGSSPPG